MHLKGNLIGILSSFLILTAGISNAVADHIDLPPPGHYTIPGTLTMFSAGIQAGTCGSISIWIMANGTHSIDFPSCSAINGPKDMIQSNHTITILDLTIDSSVGSCYGDLDGVLTLVNGGNTTRIAYDTAYSTLSGGLFGLGCAVEGHLDF